MIRWILHRYPARQVTQISSSPLRCHVAPRDSAVCNGPQPESGGDLSQTQAL